MDCEIVEEMLSAYLDEELSVEEREAVQNHLAFCPDCAALLGEFKEMSSLIYDEFMLLSAPPETDAIVKIVAAQEMRQNKKLKVAGSIGGVLLLGSIAAILLSPVGLALISIIRLFVRLASNLFSLLWYFLGDQSLLTAGVICAGAAITVFSVFAIRKMMQTIVPGP